MALFARPTVGTTEGNQHYVEMRAGKMHREGVMVYPDERKGMIYIYQNDEALMHFCWKCRTTNLVEDDFIIFPGDCEYSRVKQCTTGRVYLLKFHHSNLRCFYWLQEPNTNKDDDHCKRINYLLNHPPRRLADRPGMQVPFVLDEMDTTQLVRVFGPQMGLTIAAILEQSRATSNEPRAGASTDPSEPVPQESTQENEQPSTTTSSDNVRMENLKVADHSKKFLVQEDTGDQSKRVRKKDSEKEEVEEANKDEDDDDDDEELD